MRRCLPEVAIGGKEEEEERGKEDKTIGLRPSSQGDPTKPSC